MAVSVGEVMAATRCWFVLDTVSGQVAAEGGALTAPLPDSRATWFAVKGYGVYEAGSLPDFDEADGTVWELRPPEAFLRLCRDISAWDDAHGGTVSEKLGDWSVTNAESWRAAFSDRLGCWQRMFTEVAL